MAWLKIFGKSVSEEVEVKKLIGYVPEETGAFGVAYPREFLNLLLL
ncbi:MAG: hypothetical protein QW510_00605 [Candidatus Bathyarchaeia archaeon]